MLKVNKYLLQFLMVFLFTLYIGEDRGQFVSGINTEIGAVWKAKFDIRSYITGINSGGFMPNMILYKAEFGSDNINIRHECFHGIDALNPEQYNKTVLSIGTIF